MYLSDENLLQLCSRAEEYVVKAGSDYLLPLLNKAQTSRKCDGSLVTEADLAVNQYLSRNLANRWPKFSILSEEMSDQDQIKALKYKVSGLWCIDPLDGTTNFSAAVPYFAISLALIIKGVVEIALVYDPVRREMFKAIKGEGVWLNDVSLRSRSEPDRLCNAIANIDFKRLSSSISTKLIQAPPYYSQRNFGACALEFCWLAAGRIHVYLHGGMKLWDHAAGSLILRESGGCVSDMDGHSLVNIEDKLRTSVVAATNNVLFEQWRRFLLSG